MKVHPSAQQKVLGNIRENPSIRIKGLSQVHTSVFCVYVFFHMHMNQSFIFDTVCVTSYAWFSVYSYTFCLKNH